MELRIPEQLTMAQFVAFNKPYVEQLQRWEVLVDGHNPVARTNVVPAYGTLREASVHAFSYAAPVAQARGDFLLAGVADIDKGRIVAEGDSSIGGMRARLAFVSITVEEKLAALGVSWAQVSGVDLYAARPFESLMQPLLLPRLGAAVMHGVRWHYARPPLIGTEVELEARHVTREIVVSA